MSSKSLLKKLSFLRYEHKDCFEPNVLNANFAEFNSEGLLKGWVGHKATSVDNLKICSIRQTLKILFCHLGNSVKKWTLLFPSEPCFFLV